MQNWLERNLIKVSEFGKVGDRSVHQIELTNSSGVSVKFISFGAVIRDWIVPVGQELRSVVLGFDRIENYVQHSPFFGAIVGRVANRIKNAEFDLEGRTFQLDANETKHQLHGGTGGLSNQVWDFDIEENKDRVCFSLRSEDGAMGFPGQIDFNVSYTLRGNILRLDLSGLPDRPTPISLAQHNYFNLGTYADILGHSLFIDADRYSVLDLELIPTGEILPVLGSKFDFQTSKTFQSVGEGAMDFDINLLLQQNRDLQKPVAIVCSPAGDLTLKLSTDRPGLQLFNSATINLSMPGNGGKFYGPYSGFCLEDQMVPGALHIPEFPSIICTPDAPYRHWCEIEIS